MPRPKQTLIALFILAAYVLCAACTETDECTQVSKDLRKFNGQSFSFAYSSDMKIDPEYSWRPKSAPAFNDSCMVEAKDSKSFIVFSARAVGALGKTPREELDSSVNSVLKMISRREAYISPIYESGDVMRSFKKGRLKGKLLRFKLKLIDPQKEDWRLIIELYVYKKGDKHILLRFSNITAYQALADCYFKIITDSFE